MDVNVKVTEKQCYNNITIFPLINNETSNFDFLDLKTGLDMGIVKVEELKNETVSKIAITNNSIAPLLIIDGEEVKGSLQNRIISKTILIAPNKKEEIEVNCSEKGRWSYKSEFNHSNYFANLNTRRLKLDKQIKNQKTQEAVWDSINQVEIANKTLSKTSALRDSYEMTKKMQNEYLKEFKPVKNQVGVIIAIGNEIILIEIINNPKTYKKYHEMLLKSVIIDNLSKNTEEKNNISFNEVEVSEILEYVLESDLTPEKTIGLGKYYRLSNQQYNGAILTLDDQLIHGTFLEVIKDYPIKKDNFSLNLNINQESSYQEI